MSCQETDKQSKN